MFRCNKTNCLFIVDGYCLNSEVNEQLSKVKIRVIIDICELYRIKGG